MSVPTYNLPQNSPAYNKPGCILLLYVAVGPGNLIGMQDVQKMRDFVLIRGDMDAPDINLIVQLKSTLSF
jgi:hypothetical protein